jgi:hypothetical protein
MPAPPLSESDPALLLRAPLWGAVLDGAVGLISEAPASRRSSTESIQWATDAVDRAESRLLVALEDAPGDAGVVPGLIGDTVWLLLAAEGVSQQRVERLENHQGLVRQLRRRLSGHEESVLAGEVTYSVRPEAGRESATRLRHALGRVGEGTSQVELFSLRKDVIGLAALLILAAANVAASGSGREAPHARTSELDQTLTAITRVLALNAQRVERPVDPSGDVVAHHLAAGLRVRAAPETLARLEASSNAEPGDARCLDEATDAWFQLATNDYVAARELDHQLEAPAYADCSSSLDGAILEGAAHVICGARLPDRPSWFLHRRAWGHHTVALTYAMEAYVAGIRGDPASLAQAQLITLTRLTRATTALAMLELRREATPPPATGRPKR